MSILREVLFVSASLQCRFYLAVGTMRFVESFSRHCYSRPGVRYRRQWGCCSRLHAEHLTQSGNPLLQAINSIQGTLQPKTIKKQRTDANKSEEATRLPSKQSILNCASCLISLFRFFVRDFLLEKSYFCLFLDTLLQRQQRRHMV